LILPQISAIGRKIVDPWEERPFGRGYIPVFRVPVSVLIRILSGDAVILLSGIGVKGIVTIWVVLIWIVALKRIIAIGRRRRIDIGIEGVGIVIILIVVS